MSRDILAPAGNAAKFDEPGKTYKGRVLSVEQRQQKDYATGTPKVWDDGSPMMEAVVTIQPAEGDTVALYVRGKMLGAVREAVAKAGAQTVEIGGTLAVQYEGDGEPSKPGFAPPKLYRAQYVAPAVTGNDLLAPATPAPQAAAADLI